MDLLENPKLPHMLRRLNTKDFKKFNTFTWNGTHISAVVRFLQRSSRSTHHDNSIMDTLTRLEASRNTTRFPRMVLSFTEKLSEFFRVPKVEDFSNNYRTSELLASFLDFLLDTVEEIVKCHSNLVDQVEDQINILHKELKFLITILGDTPFGFMLKEVEDVAAHAASFLYLYFFTDEGTHSRIDVSLAKLLKKFEKMETKISEHCLRVSKLPSFGVPSSVVVHSVFMVNSLVNDIDDLLVRKDDDDDDDLITGIRTLQEELMLLRSFLEFFKGQQNQAELVLRIRDVAYEAEYLINSYVVGHVPVWYLTLRLPNVIQKIKVTGIGLEEIKKNYNDVKYHVNSFMVGDVPVWYLKPRLPDVADEIKITVENPKKNDDIVVGFEDEAMRIADHLTGGVPMQLQAVSIIGMPGLGKTTLAKRLYNDPAVCYQFDYRAWVVVSETYHKKNLLVDILKSIKDIDRGDILSMDAESLGVELHKTLVGRRYLIVIDDVWSPTVWDEMRWFFPDDRNGSRILVTTRHKDVAPDCSNIYALPFLSDDQCWDLLQHKLQDCPPELVDIGKKIAMRCHGLPLAVVVIAAVLAKMGNRKSLWNEVAGSLGLQISNDTTNCIKILELSYKHLPIHLKPCFLYFGAFPEDKEISVSKLISLWIAEGFIQEEDQKTLRDVAEEYLMDLIDRSLVLIAKGRSGGGVKACRIHDLLRELCLRKAKEENFMNVIKDQFLVYEKHHRLCIPPESINVESRPFGLHIRSWLGCWSDNTSFIYSRLKLLRVLDLSTENDTDLTGIEQLVHLRYLAVRVTDDRIPPSIGRLHNLEFLHFDGPSSMEISEALVNLVRLRHLQVTKHATLGESFHKRALVGKGFNMDSLESISNLWIIHEDDEKLLRRLPGLRRLKCATRPLWDSSQKCRRYLVLDDYPSLLESLNMSYLGSGEFKFSGTINLPPSLKKLTLHEFKLSWKEMSMIGRLPKLEVLKLSYAVFDGKEWKTKDDEFKELKFLKMEGLKIHRWNASTDHFPKLQRLVMHKCWKLKKLPCGLGDISTLQIIDIHSCSKSVANSALEIQNDQLQMGNEELKVIIAGSCW